MLSICLRSGNYNATDALKGSLWVGKIKGLTYEQYMCRYWKLECHYHIERQFRVSEDQGTTQCAGYA